MYSGMYAGTCVAEAKAKARALMERYLANLVKRAVLASDVESAWMGQ